MYFDNERVFSGRGLFRNQDIESNGMVIDCLVRRCKHIEARMLLDLESRRGIH
jgi:hypothetical protein